MPVKRRHFTTRHYTKEEYSSSSSGDESSGDEEEEKVAKVPKISEIKELDVNNVNKTQSLYRVIESKETTTSTPAGGLVNYGSESDSLDGEDTALQNSDDGSEEDSDDGTDSSDDSSEEEEEELKSFRPVFVPKNKRLSNKSHHLDVQQDKKEITIRKLQHNISTAMAQEKLKLTEANSADKEDLGGVDDTDNLDPKQEYELWREREVARLNLHKAKLIRKEEEEEETYKRREQFDDGVLRVENPTTDEQPKVAKALGAFFNNNGNS